MTSASTRQRPGEVDETSAFEGGASEDLPAPAAVGPGDVTVPARSGFGPPVPGSRVDTITAAPAVPAAVDDDVVIDDEVTAVDEVTVADDVVVEHEAAVEQPRMEQPVPEEPVEDEPVVESSPEFERNNIGDDEVNDDKLNDDKLRDDEAPAGDALAEARDDAEGQVGDDFWTGAASEDSVPTRRVVYGARSERDESWRRSWVRSVRRRRRR